MKTKFGQRTNLKNAWISFKKSLIFKQISNEMQKLSLIYPNCMCVSLSQSPLSLNTFSITSRPQPLPPSKGEI